MRIVVFSSLLLLCSTLIPLHSASAENQKQVKPIYGSQLMTDKERADYLKTLNGIKTKNDRVMFILEHEELMQDTARSKGVKLPGM